MNTDARDGMHPGPDWHERVAEYYFQAAKLDIERIISWRKVNDDLNDQGLPISENPRLS